MKVKVVMVRKKRIVMVREVELGAGGEERVVMVGKVRVIMPPCCSSFSKLDLLSVTRV